jgi:hypothetical protein
LSPAIHPSLFLPRHRKIQNDIDYREIQGTIRIMGVNQNMFEFADLFIYSFNTFLNDNEIILKRVEVERYML